MARVIEIPYAPRDAFMPMHKRTTRWSVIVAHRRAGKTVACVNELIKAALLFGRHDGRFAYVSPFYKQSKSVSWDYFKYFVRVIPGVEINESELRIDFPNGSRITLFGADKADALRGLYFDGLVADEFGDWKPSVWQYVIRPALADRQGWAIIIGTPKGRNEFYARVKHAEQDANWQRLIIRAMDSGILPQSEMDAMKSEMTEDAWRQEMECDFDAALPGAIYGKEMWQLEQEGRVKPIEYDRNFPVHTAWDLGRSDDTAIWFFQLIANEIRIIDYHASNGGDVGFYASIIKSKPYSYGDHWLPHDAVPETLAANGRSIIQQLWALQVKCKITPRLGQQDGIQAARLMLPRVWFDAEKCADGIDCLKQYQREFDEDKKCFKDKPRHDWTSHAADAFRYLAVVWKEELKPAKKEAPKFFNNMTFDEVCAASTASAPHRERI